MHCVKTPSSPKQDDVSPCSNCGKSCGNNKVNVLAHETKCFKNTTRKPVKGNMCVTSVEVNIQNPTREDSRNIWQIV